MWEYRTLIVGVIAATISSLAYPIYLVEYMGGWTKTHPLTAWMWPTFGLKGDVHPRFVSWFIWMLLALTLFLSAVKADAIAPACICLAYGLGNLALLLASLKRGSWEMRWYDPICIILGIVALVFLYREDDPESATALSIVADVIAGFSTFTAVISRPQDESRTAWNIFFIGGALNVLAFTHPFTPSAWGFVETTYTLYIVTCTAYMCIMVRRTPPS